MLSILIPIAAFVGVAALVGGLAMLLRGDVNEQVESRLDSMTGSSNTSSIPGISNQGGLLNADLLGETNQIEDFVAKYFNLKLFLEQAQSNMSVSKFVLVTLGLAGAGLVLPTIIGAPVYVGPIVAVMLAICPITWVKFKRGRRLNAFGNQMPDALELISRALRAGHSLGAGFQLVGDELKEPIGSEFRKVFESQNLGVPLEDAIELMTERIPNLDLKFFGTAIVLQRQTGGDLAEILDKIGKLVRQRMELRGQIQALTGEGRISGIVLLAMPPVLFIVMWRLNPTYVMMLFTDPLGNQMLAGAVVAQLLGAYVIKKIIDIKV
ncbi:MAG: secretion protein [Blastopirellula sp.]|nr:MAG: secretion protein [Blastopirellula sp.]